MAGNQLGKTLAGGNEAAMHATGRILIGGRVDVLMALLLAGRAA